MYFFPISTSIEQGFSFISTNTSSISSIVLSLISFETISVGRSIQLKIRDGNNINGPILYTNTFVISNVFSIIDYTFTLVGGPFIIFNNYYTITITDVTAGGLNTGYTNLYGITSSSNVYNINTYPRCLVYTSIGITFAQLSNSILTDRIPTSIESGFKFIPTISGIISNITLNLTAFESISPGRSLVLKVRSGAGVAGAILYNNTFIINNNLYPIDYNFSVNIPVTASSIYTLTLIDITSGGHSSGNVYIYGIYGNNQNTTYTSYNTIIYPKLFIYIANLTDTFIQPLSLSQSDIVSTVSEYGFRFSPLFSGLLTSFSLNLTSFDSTGSRSLIFRVRENSGVVGTILYQDTVFIPNISERTDYLINIDSMIAPSLLSGNNYTLTVIDISGGTGNVILYGISTNGEYVSYNTTIYPKLFIYIPSYIITITPSQNFDGFLADNTDNIEFNSQAKENATYLYFNGLPSTRASYYKVNLKWLNLPNKLLNVGNGGRLDNYPYIYVQLYNEGNNGSLNVINSNNPNSFNAIFKCPIDRKFEDTPTSFITLKVNNKEQIIKFRPDQNTRLTLTLPDGTIISNKEADNPSPLFPNPLLQVNALFTILPVEDYGLN